ncbi:helix-turn-helix domain-containing protein [Pedobacter antarcticus]|uniref:helix-turn-helix domain-containing protein n=1 Tax=Pedobacter antarcticus TaxID=34086 RepID=UPI0008818E98|nr:helix-turn-helix domain-containing protein [Pedobacter antarcticus]SDL45318.1 transcriptional regulator, AraC family [Pedobacter antarcticus]
MKKNVKSIPVFQLPEGTTNGLEVMQFLDFTSGPEAVMPVHRDEHYIFIFQQSGTSVFEVDFKSMILEGAGLMLVRSGQVHQVQNCSGITGWILALDKMLIDDKFRLIFENCEGMLPLYPEKECLQLVEKTIQLISEVHHNKLHARFHRDSLSLLVKAYTGFFAGTIESSLVQTASKPSRPVSISNAFKLALSRDFREVKQPAAYARALCLSLSYLNEVVKQVTGFPVSYWIKDIILLEAKRLLCYTDLNINQIADELGYTDYAYFNRLFSRNTGTSPLEFRRKYHG